MKSIVIVLNFKNGVRNPVTSLYHPDESSKVGDVVDFILGSHRLRCRGCGG